MPSESDFTVGFIPDKWGASTIVKSYKGKGLYFKRRNYRGLKSIDKIL